MSRYAIIRSDTWNDEEFMELSPIGKLLYIYLLSTSYGNSIGYFRLPASKAAADMMISEKEILPELVGQNKLWKYDAETKQVLIVSYLKYNKLSSPSQLKGINAQLKPLTRGMMDAEFMYCVYKHLGEKCYQYIDRDILYLISGMTKDRTEIKYELLYNSINQYILSSQEYI